MGYSKRNLAGAVLLAWMGLFSVVTQVAAQSYPTKPIRLLTGFAVGASDTTARALADAISPTLGQAVIVEARTGAGGAIAMNVLADSPGDGYTIGLGTFGGIAVGPNLRKTAWDPVKSFTYITLLSDIPLVLIVPSTVSPGSVNELIALLKAQPGKLNYGSDGIGSGTHLAFELFKQRTGVDAVHVPFKAAPDMLAAFKRGDVQVAFQGVAAALALRRLDDRIKVLAVAAPQRAAEFPDAPTMQQAGLPGFEVASWLCILGPAGIPGDIVQRLNREMRAALARPDVAQKLTNVGLPPKGSTPEEMAARVARENALWRDVIQKAKIEVVD